ncbi:MAG: Ribosomal RNA-processing protein 7 [Thelocarpon impressellum]|nr:MAG: Ribosomal RNA-processing protein 7 [Thelocarpon impressellum]
MAESDVPRSIGDYSVLPLELPALASLKTPAVHYLYLRRHGPKIPAPDDARTLFAVNVPVDATEYHFRALFASLGGGRVERVDFEGGRIVSKPAAAPPVLSQGKSKKRKRDDIVEDASLGSLPEIWDRDLRRSGGTALIIFVDKASLEAGMKGLRKWGRKALRWGGPVEEKIPALGSARYLAHHQLRYPPRGPLQSSIDAFMTQYAALEAQRAQKAARLRQEPDEDGFITVTRGGRTGPARLEEAQAAAEKQRGKEGLRDFYRFQTREERKKAQGELVRKFEEDRRRVDEMKRKRGKFKPE